MVAVLIGIGMAFRGGDYVLAGIGIVVWGGYCVAVAFLTQRALKVQGE
jgi:hypothetical protein